MFDIALFEPEIPPNTGNIMRLAANTGAHLHLIEPLGFSMDEKRLRRAGLDYREFARVIMHASFDDFLVFTGERRLLALTTRASRCYSEMDYQDDDVLLFGPETRGLPTEILDRLPSQQKLRIPMLPERRSLNLANAVSIVLYEAWRQLEFAGAVKASDV